MEIDAQSQRISAVEIVGKVLEDSCEVTEIFTEARESQEI